MNTASRMESTCKPGCVQVSELFAQLLPLEDWEDTGGVEVKGKGHMQTYLWTPKPEDLIPLGVGPRPALGGPEDDSSLDDVQAPAPSAISSAVTTAPDDSAADRTEIDGTTRSTAASPARPKSGRASYARPKSSRPKSSRYVRPTTARMRESQNGGVHSRPSTASSHGGLTRAPSARLGRSLSRRNVSFRFHGGDEGGEGDEAGGAGSTPFMAILNAIRGSGTGEGDEGTDDELEGVPRRQREPSMPMRRPSNNVSLNGGAGPTGSGSLSGPQLSLTGGLASGSGGSRQGTLSGGLQPGSRAGTAGGPLANSSGSGALQATSSGLGGGGSRVGTASGGQPSVVQHVDLDEAMDVLKPSPSNRPSDSSKPLKAVRLSLTPEAAGGPPPRPSQNGAPVRTAK